MKEITKIMEFVSEKYNSILGPNLVGINLHGSAAFGCFNWERSDVDFTVVIQEPISRQAKLQLIQVLYNLNGQIPPRGFEMSIVLARYCKDFIYPTPCELQFKSCYTEQYMKELLMQYDDAQFEEGLAADFTVIKSVGIVICGAPR